MRLSMWALDGCGRLTDSFEFAAYLAEEQGLAVVPGGAFSEEGDGWVRFSYALPPSDHRGRADPFPRRLEGAG